MTSQGLVFLALCLWSVFVLSQNQQALPLTNTDTDVDNNSWEISVVVTGAKPETGQIILSVFDSDEAFLETPLQTLNQKADFRGIAEFKLTGLADSYYSLSVFYDEDENGELNTNFFGIPSEAVGFSTNAKGRFGPPDFEQTKFKPSKLNELEINLIKVTD